MASAKPALPRLVPCVDWDPQLGVFLIGLNNPEWEAVRLARVAQLDNPRPIVGAHRRSFRDGFRRWRRRISWSLDILLGRRP